MKIKIRDFVFTEFIVLEMIYYFDRLYLWCYLSGSVKCAAHWTKECIMPM